MKKLSSLRVLSGALGVIAVMAAVPASANPMGGRVDSGGNYVLQLDMGLYTDGVLKFYINPAGDYGAMPEVTKVELRADNSACWVVNDGTAILAKNLEATNILFEAIPGGGVTDDLIAFKDYTAKYSNGVVNNDFSSGALAAIIGWNNKLAGPANAVLVDQVAATKFLSLRQRLGGNRFFVRPRQNDFLGGTGTFTARG